MNSVFKSETDQKLGLLICGHGSRNRIAVKEFADLVDSIRDRLPEVPVEYGYLEFARPTLRDGLDALRKQSVQRVIAIPAMLFAAAHAKNDIPSVLNTYSSETGLIIDYGRELGVDRQMIAAAGYRLKAALDKSPSEMTPSQTMLAVVGRGSSDPDANANVSKITRMLTEAFGFGWGETLYSGVTFPLVEPGLRHLVRLGFRRILVLPYFLFSGVLVSRIRQHTERVAQDNPTIEFVDVDYLGAHSLVVDTFIDRIDEVINGQAAMNCALCKYREQVLGFETEVGAPQLSHHHHVEGIAESCSLCAEECTGACQVEDAPSLNNSTHHDHHHSHNHYPYPNSDHPLGPKTLKH